MSLRMSGEEALSRELTGRGMQGVATYRLMPHEELKDVARESVVREGIGGRRRDYVP